MRLLIHCNEDQDSPCDTRVPVSFPTGDFIEVMNEVNAQAGINIRPFAKVILQELSKHFEIVVFTASHACYANPVIDYLDPEGTLVTKSDCSETTAGRSRRACT
jgi:CTD small phosphatase-like protein 2